MSIFKYLKRLSESVLRGAQKMQPAQVATPVSTPAKQTSPPPAAIKDGPMCMYCKHTTAYSGIMTAPLASGHVTKTTFYKCESCGAVCAILVRPMVRRDAIGRATADKQPALDVFWTKPVDVSSKDQARLRELERQLSKQKTPIEKRPNPTSN